MPPVKGSQTTVTGGVNGPLRSQMENPLRLDGSSLAVLKATEFREIPSSIRN